MDAAIDATREMGFDEKLVRATVNDPLKVYKGDNRTENPWRFIEEGSYTLLVEQLLEKVEAQEAAEKRNAAEKLPFFLPSWTGMYVVNAFIVVWVLVVGFGFGGWASVTNFIRQVDTFGLFAKCYQCPPKVPASLPLPHH